MKNILYLLENIVSTLYCNFFRLAFLRDLIKRFIALADLHTTIVRVRFVSCIFIPLCSDRCHTIVVKVTFKLLGKKNNNNPDKTRPCFM